MSAHRYCLRSQRLHGIDDRPGIGAVVGTAEKVGMNAEFSVSCRGSAPNGRTLMGYENCRLDREAFGNLEEDCNTVLRSPIEIGCKYKVQDSPFAGCQS